MRPEDLHVLVVTRAVAPIHGMGGLERHVHDLIHHLLTAGIYRLTLVTAPPASGSAFASNSLAYDRLSLKFVPYRTFPLAGRRGTTVVDRSTAYPWFGWRAGQLAANLVKQGGVQIVHGMGAAALGYALERRGDWFGTVPLILNPHGMEEFGSTGPALGGLKHAAYGPLRSAVRATARSADRVVATDRALVPFVLKHLEVEESRVAIVPNAVDLEAVDRLTNADRAREVRERIGLAPFDLLLVGGGLEENKGFHHLVAALARLAQEPSGRSLLGDRWRCVILGEGTARARLERDIASARLTDVVLLPGRVSDSDLHAWYEAATLFVHPSLYEGSSIVTLEAMAHRRAVVGTMAGGIPDKVRPGINGWLVAAGNEAALAEAIREALAARERRADMGRAGRAIVEQEFSWTAAATRWLALYEEVLTREGQRPRRAG